jgi:ABC-type Fe3+/spermidine/putrescine transport system ATPase subunit
MREGRFIQVGEPGAAYDNPASAWVANFLGSTNSIDARVDTSGALLTAAGPLTAGYRDPALAAGDAAVAIIRPEMTRIQPRSAAATNTYDGRLVDLVAVGPSLRLKAVTASGLAFEAVTGRSPSESIRPGDPVSISFDPSAVRVYRADGPASSQPARSQLHA